MDLKASLKRARNLSIEKGCDMVVGDDAGSWIILPLSDARSDSLRPSFIVGPDGLKYPEDHEAATRLMAEGR